MVYHIIEYYSAVKRDEVVIHATTINLENIMLSKRSQSQMTKCSMIPLNEMSLIGKSIETESRLMVVRD